MAPNKRDLLKQFTEEEDNIFGDIEGFEYEDVDTLRMNKFHPHPSQSSSPSFAIHSSPMTGKRVTRETLSEYSEENDTDPTSQFSEDGFSQEDFEKVTSIYQEMNQRLIATKVAQQKEYEKEKLELMSRRRDHFDPNQTLKVKDYNKLTNENLTLLDQLDNEKTVNYDYVRDDKDDFEDGFVDKDFEMKLRIQPSMPTLRQNVPSLKKYKSHGEFKCDSRVRSKLDRIPSFYTKDHLLSKYKENKPRQQSHKKMGTVKCLNNNSEVPFTFQNPGSMRLNSAKNRWEGNEIDLMRFEKPSLITPGDAKSRKQQGNMIYDEQNLRWINMDHDDQNVFDDIPDLDDKKLRSPIRGLSQFTLRTASTATLNTEPRTVLSDLGLTSKLVDKFRKEQIKIEKKISNWFQDPSSDFNRDHYWEIRKMVTED
ncbi:BFA1 Mitotic check point protein BFA1 [Candida maltosa Xu316]